MNELSISHFMKLSQIYNPVRVDILSILNCSPLQMQLSWLHMLRGGEGHRTLLQQCKGSQWRTLGEAGQLERERVTKMTENYA